MGFQEIWVSLVSCNSDEHKLIWVYLGLVFGRALLTDYVDIYLCLIFLFIFLNFENHMILLCFRLE